MNQQNSPYTPKIDGQSATITTDQATADCRKANQALVQRFYDEIVNRKNLNALGELFADNIVAHELDYRAQGGDLLGVLAGLPDVQTTVSLWVIESDLVTAIVTFSGTHRGELLGIAPTGRAVTFSLIDIWRVKDGKLVDLWHNVPNCDILAQISS
ncbi:MAG: ester cyclase [Caldilineaceae bacterium]